MSGLVVRYASVADAAAIAHVHVQAWREAYARQLPADFLAGLDEERRADGWVTIIEDDVTEVLVAEIDGRVIGWATSSAGRDAEAPAPRELEGIYVLQAEHGTGVGQQLLETAVGSEPAFLWMLDGNRRAEAFYRRNSFERDGGERTTQIGGQMVHVVRMVRREPIAR